MQQVKQREDDDIDYFVRVWYSLCLDDIIFCK